MCAKFEVQQVQSESRSHENRSVSYVVLLLLFNDGLHS